MPEPAGSMPELLQVAPGIDRWVMPEATMNAVVIADAGEALVVDPGTLPARAAELRAAIEARGDRVVAVVITHAHWDHCFALAVLDDVPAYAHPATIAELREHGETQREAVLGFSTGATADAVRHLEIVLPGSAVPEPRTLRIGALEVELEPLGPAHTSGDLVIHAPAAGVTIAGDLVETADDPQLDESTEVSGWLRALDRLASHAQPLLVPGHGEPCGHERLAHHRALLEGFASAGT
ncbi:Glyoxylase, beta-lactamase superfamily II [Agrococcus baldri]|uniref:Glyoxylase, beta-lactamase superfamily II n=1 Tax=Agrococcus baldri TaxID=153730 RepID=A0AA94HLF9_9MICO|nr:MBL fold metallo-hydrolase [Agrococcus baldri]SFS07009.1 Glyoxylase, beta-lactamase superfamily II [Agrococcus baldri]